MAACANGWSNAQLPDHAQIAELRASGDDSLARLLPTVFVKHRAIYQPERAELPSSLQQPRNLLPPARSPFRATATSMGATRIASALAARLPSWAPAQHGSISSLLWFPVQSSPCQAGAHACRCPFLCNLSELACQGRGPQEPPMFAQRASLLSACAKPSVGDPGTPLAVVARLPLVLKQKKT